MNVPAYRAAEADLWKWAVVTPTERRVRVAHLGTEDPGRGRYPHFGGEDVARWIAGSMANATLEMVEGSGHLPWLDFPERVAASTRSFLTGVRA